MLISVLHSRLMLLLCLASSVTQSNAAAGSASGWKAGVSAVVITPDKPMWMAGYASRTNASQGKIQDLYAKALALDDGTGNRLVIVTLDLITVPRLLRQKVEAAVLEEHHLPRESLLMNCSHTHSGPEFRMDGRTKDWAIFGPDDVADVKSREQYGTELQAKILDAIRTALQGQAAARVSYQHARCGFSMNRRTLVGTNYNNFPNPEGHVDQDVPVLRVDGADGKLRAVLFGYACHNTTVALYQLCGDYAGYAQQYFEAAHPGVVGLFMQGCGGDQNPYPRGTFELAQLHGRTLATAVDAALQTRGNPLTGRLRMAYGEVEIDYAGPPTQKEYEDALRSSDRFEVQHAQKMLGRLKQGETLPRKYPFPVQVVQFGGGLTMVGLAGETVVGYSLRLKKELAGRSLWVAGYCNDVMAYIPIARQLGEGGYEPHTSIFLSEIHPGPWASSLEERIIGKVHELDRVLTGQRR